MTALLETAEASDEMKADQQSGTAESTGLEWKIMNS